MDKKSSRYRLKLVYCERNLLKMSSCFLRLRLCWTLLVPWGNSRFSFSFHDGLFGVHSASGWGMAFGKIRGTKLRAAATALRD